MLCNKRKGERVEKGEIPRRNRHPSEGNKGEL